MYYGYMTLGEPESISDISFELVNTMRVQSYVQNWNTKVRQDGESWRSIKWLEDCGNCTTAGAIFSNGAGYFLPEVDQAPWYSADVRDSEKFFGVMGLEAAGAEDSTRSATVQPSVAGGGAVSRLRFGARQIVVRGLAVAADSCGMEVGLNWLRCWYEEQIQDCGGDALWFLDCCPDCESDPNSPPVSPCWPSTYEELANGPADCPDGTCWLTTYEDFVLGPNGGNYEVCGWCSWIVSYQQIIDGLPEFACNITECGVPYIRQFLNVRITEGPVILNRQSMPSGGEIAEIEFTISCGDPAEYTPVVTVTAARSIGSTVAVTDEAEATGKANPFVRSTSSQIPRGPSNSLALPKTWTRAVIPYEPERVSALSGLKPNILIAAEEGQEGPVRVGVWEGEHFIDGFVLPFMPPKSTVMYDGRRREFVTEHEGRVMANNGFARSFTGGGRREFATLSPGKKYRVTVDQVEGKEVDLVVELQASEVGCA